jgi:predicted negative regulator of RcsB-dependent stress response
MHFNLEEQEQLAEFKAWWKRYGNWLLAIFTVVAVSYGSYATYGWWNKKSSLGASKVYELVLIGAQKQDIPAILKATSDLQDQYKSTSYAGMASLVAAQVTNAAGDLANSEKNLRWALDKAKVTAHQDIARARLVSLLIDQDKFDEARKVAAASVSKPFEPLLLERRGDVEFAQQKNTEARKLYQEAWDLLLKNADASDESKRLLKIKLDAVGGRS